MGQEALTLKAMSCEDIPGKPYHADSEKVYSEILVWKNNRPNRAKDYLGRKGQRSSKMVAVGTRRAQVNGYDE